MKTDHCIINKMILLFFILVTFVFSCFSEINNNKVIGYKIIRESIDKDWGSWVVVVDSIYRNEKDLKILGIILKENTKKFKYSFVFVFDNLSAAEMEKKASNLNAKEKVFYKKHFIAQYLRSKDGTNRFDILLSKEDIHFDY